MNSSLRSKRRVCAIHVRPYLAVWARQKFPADPVSGGLVLPARSDLYHCVWQLMERQPRQAPPATEEPNLLLHLPYRRRQDGVEGKDPAFWNYLSPRSMRMVETQLRNLFNWEFHQWMELNLQAPCPVESKVRLRQFITRYQLGLDAEDMLLKNWQRHRSAAARQLGIAHGRHVRIRRQGGGEP